MAAFFSWLSFLNSLWVLSGPACPGRKGDSRPPEASMSCEAARASPILLIWLEVNALIVGVGLRLVIIPRQRLLRAGSQEK